MSKKTFGKIFKIVGIAALVAVAVVTVVATAGAGWSFAVAKFVLASLKYVIAGALLALAVGNTLLAMDKAAKAARSAMADNLIAQVVPNADALWAFGTTTAGNQIVYAEKLDTKNERVIQVLAGIAHEIESFGQLYLDDETVTFSGNTAIGAWSGAVSQEVRLGTESQTAITTGSLPSTARGRGFAYHALIWDLRKDKLKDVGVRNRVTRVVNGCKCYDPRLDTTVGGSGSHRIDDQSTWTFTKNWALICLFYIIGWKINGKLIIGMGVDESEIDLSSFMTCANVCDALVDGIARYEVGGLIYIDGDHAKVLSTLEGMIGGKILATGGRYQIWAPYNDLTPIATFTEENILDASSIQVEPGKYESVYNTVQGQYIEPTLLYQPETYPEIVEEAALTAHGSERFYPLDLPYIQVLARAQRIARQMLRRSLYQDMWLFPVDLSYAYLDVFDVIRINMKYTNDEDVIVRIMDKNISIAGGYMILTVQEENSAIYDTSEPLLLGTTRTVPDTFDRTTAIPVTGLTAEGSAVYTTTGTALDSIEVSWDDPGPIVMRTEVEYRQTGTTTWIPAPARGILFTSGVITAVESGVTYDIRVRHITVFHIPSEYAETTANTGIAREEKVGNLELNGQGNDTVSKHRDFKFTWTYVSPLQEDVGVADSTTTQDPNFADFRIRVYNSGQIVREDVTTQYEYIYSIEKNLEDQERLNGSGSLPLRAFTFEVVVRNKQGGVSAPATLAVSNPAPDVLTNITFSSAVGGVLANAEIPLGTLDNAGFLLHRHPVSSFTPSDDNLVQDASTLPTFVEADAGTPYYYKIAAYDTFGKTGLNYSGAILATALTKIDNVAPAVPTGLDASSEAFTDENGVQQIRLTMWCDRQTEEDMSYYEFEVIEDGGDSFPYNVPQTESGITPRHQLPVRPNTSYAIRVRAVDRDINKSSFTSTHNITSAIDTTPPAVPTSPSATGTFKAVWLQWTPATDNDLAGTKIYVNTVDNASTATLLTVAPGSVFVHSGLDSLVTRYYWFSSVDTSGNESNKTSTAVSATTVRTATVDYTPLSIDETIVADDAISTPKLQSESVTTNVLDAEAVTAEKVVLNEAVITQTAQLQNAIITDAKVLSLSAAKLTAGTALAGSITVDGSALTTIGTNAATGAQDPATRINAGSTKINPGLITISGSTTLYNLLDGTDQTKINGGNISANSLDASRMKIGSRNVSYEGIAFEPNDPASNYISWTAGTITYPDNSGTIVTQATSSGSAQWTGSDVYVYWTQGSSSINATTSKTTAFDGNNVVLATYRGAGDMVATYGRTIIDRDSIKTNAISAAQIEAGTLTANLFEANITLTDIIVIGDSVAVDGVANEIYQKNSAGTVKVFQSTESGVTLRNTAGATVLDTSSGINHTYVNGLGTLATANTVAHTDVTGLGTLATENSVAHTDVTGLGDLATEDSISYSDVTGSKPPINAETNRPFFGIATQRNSSGGSDSDAISLFGYDTDGNQSYDNDDIKIPIGGDLVSVESGTNGQTARTTGLPSAIQYYLMYDAQNSNDFNGRNLAAAIFDQEDGEWVYWDGNSFESIPSPTQHKYLVGEFTNWGGTGSAVGNPVSYGFGRSPYVTGDISHTNAISTSNIATYINTLTVDSLRVAGRAITSTTAKIKTSDQTISNSLSYQDVTSLVHTATFPTSSEVIIHGFIICLCRVRDADKFSVDVRLTRDNSLVSPELEQVGGKGDQDINADPEDWYFTVPFSFKFSGSGSSDTFQIEISFAYPSEGSTNFNYPDSLKITAGAMIIMEALK